MVSTLAISGFMGSGKTSVGRAAARLLGWRFVDLDEFVEERIGKPVAAMFADEGEEAFRQVEFLSLKTVLGDCLVPTVIALGGGTLTVPGAAELVRQHGGTVVFLQLGVREAWMRVTAGPNGAGTRPLASSWTEFEALARAREDGYLASADVVVAADGRGVEDLAAEVVRVVQSSPATRAAAEASGEWARELWASSGTSMLLGGHDALARLGAWAAAVANRKASVFVITDTNVARYWLPHLMEVLGDAGDDAHVCVLRAGERTKSVGQAGRLWDWLSGAGAHRDDVIVALGGGVVGDLAGFVAATYLRGVELWQVPTSLLAQVDSSVGGKTGVNLSAGKNLVGAFHQARLVVADSSVLSTLPVREFRNGLGEVVKYALLVGEDLLGVLEAQSAAISRRDSDPVSRVVAMCVGYKAGIVEVDETDAGGRAVLNLGHTAAHALEKVLGFGRLGHGVAVGLGLLVALAASEEVLSLDESVRLRTARLLEKLGLPTRLDLPAAAVLAEAAMRDKKVTGAGLRFVGVARPGEPVWGLDLPPEVLARSLEVIRT